MEINNNYIGILLLVWFDRNFPSGFGDYNYTGAYSLLHLLKSNISLLA